MSAGSNPAFPSMLYDKNSYVINNLNLALSKKTLLSKLVLSKKTLNIIQVLYKSGLLKNYFITNSKVNYIYFSIFFYKNTTFFKNVRLISTRTKKFYVSFKALLRLSRVMRSTVLILETNKGLITNTEALAYGVGGILLATIN